MVVPWRPRPPQPGAGLGIPLLGQRALTHPGSIARLAAFVQSSGSDHRCSAGLASFPDFFAGPLLRPFERDVPVARGGPFRRSDLDQFLDLEAGTSQEPDHLSVREVELDGVVVWPFEAV